MSTCEGRRECGVDRRRRCVARHRGDPVPAVRRRHSPSVLRGFIRSVGARALQEAFMRDGGARGSGDPGFRQASRRFHKVEMRSRLCEPLARAYCEVGDGRHGHRARRGGALEFLFRGEPAVLRPRDLQSWMPRRLRRGNRLPRGRRRADDDLHGPRRLPLHQKGLRQGSSQSALHQHVRFGKLSAEACERWAGASRVGALTLE
mmetsp:Transcript_31335/g.105520  ORF Transcript_31335/g.105520 Transcript_31335/m.105520 type:complete len:204 (+) Transcript_31335:2438-3049(+)